MDAVTSKLFVRTTSLLVIAAIVAFPIQTQGQSPESIGYRTIEIEDVNVFYREAGPADVFSSKVINFLSYSAKR
ncbi:hypothetical protein Pla110_43630 [Polystyrenella longa]|uniref:Uncharacterized protein n=1 Tax=Polystyrenella longa TaxID=2528007 RepID=A0A518CTQ8_9PLAN|nr:hypothetical protein Pla110_43630 [Polystyrenella longa]